MTFAADETSVESGSVIELYKFSYAGETFYYTSADDTFTYSDRDYIPVAGLTRSPITEQSEISQSSLTLTAHPDFEVAKLFEVYPPSDVVDLVIYRVHRGSPTDVIVYWLGRVLNVSWPGGYCELRCESLYTRLRQPGLRRVYSRNCPHALYGSECGANQVSFAENAQLDSVSATQFELVSSDFQIHPDGYYSGGKVVYEYSPGKFERRGIRKHVGNTITITHPIPGLPGDADIVVYAGCDRTQPTCNDRFANGENFGGFPYVPKKNPFGSNSVY